MPEGQNPFVRPEQPGIDGIINMGISDGDLRLQKEYSAPFFGGEEKTDGEY